MGGTTTATMPVASAVYFLGEHHILAVYYITRWRDPEIKAYSATPFGAKLTINL